MKVKADCASCLMNRALSALEKSGADELTKFTVVKQVITNLNEAFNEVAVPAKLEYVDMQMLKSKTGNDDPYVQVKQKANVIAKSALKSITKKFDRNSEGDFGELVRLSIAANGLEFDVQGYTVSDRLLSSPLPPLVIDHTHQLWEDLNKATRVAFVLDNVGEHLFDLKLAEFMSYHADVEVFAKKIPLLNDVTERELASEMPERLSAVYYEPKAIGITWENFEHEYDFVYAKGMANYETLTEGEPIVPVYHALMVKCRPIALSVNAPVGSGILIKRQRQ
ncbi:MAG: ARMT1-like domain-containing protein [Thermoprotei archaeon]